MTRDAYRLRETLLVFLVALALAPPVVTPARAEVAELVASQNVEALRQLGPAVLPELLARYRTSDEAGRASLAWILYHLGWQSEEALALLLADIHTEHQGLRIWSQYALGRVSNSDAVVDALFENMKRGDARWLFRDKAACGLAYDQIHLTEPQKVRLFMRLIGELDDSDAGTRRLVIQILAVYTGQRKGYDPAASATERAASIERWWRWLAEYRAQL
jgi:hypothetical protein